MATDAPANMQAPATTAASGAATPMGNAPVVVAAIQPTAAVSLSPPPPPPPAEVVPLAERVVVPEGETLPEEMRMMRKGTDLFVSFASASMAPFALNWVANLRRAGLHSVLVGALDAAGVDWP